MLFKGDADTAKHTDLSVYFRRGQQLHYIQSENLLHNIYIYMTLIRYMMYKKYISRTPMEVTRATSRVGWSR